MSKFSVRDRVVGDPGTTVREAGSILEVDHGPSRYLVLWDSGLSYWHDERELEPESTAPSEPTGQSDLNEGEDEDPGDPDEDSDEDENESPSVPSGEPSTPSEPIAPVVPSEPSAPQPPAAPDTK